MGRHRRIRIRKWHFYCVLVIWPVITLSYVWSAYLCMDRNCGTFLNYIPEATIKKVMDSFWEDAVRKPEHRYDGLGNTSTWLQTDGYFDNTTFGINYTMSNMEQTSEWTQPRTDYGFVRRIQTVAAAMEHRLKSQLFSAIKTSNSTRSDKRAILDIIENVEDIKETLSHELNLVKLQSAASHIEDSPAEWDRTEKAMEKVFQKLTRLQNPSNCMKARKLVCDLNKSCGFGCQFHHAVYCLVVSYALNRVLVIKDSTWSYAPSGWRKFFRPWSATCQGHWAMRPDVLREGTIGPWERTSQVSEYLHCTLIDLLERHPDFLPPAVPKQVGKLVEGIHEHPFLWWVSQLVRYLMRPSREMKALVEKVMADIGFWGPIVGVHIRRTDKLLREGSYYPVKSYFKYVEEYFRKLHEAGVDAKPRVFLATDDTEALTEALESYPHIDILYITEHIDSAESNNRYNEQSLEYLLVDIYLLANSDFLVCTLSSQICRLAYELMQSYWVDASTRVISLDQSYYFGGQSPGLYEVTSDYLPPDTDGLRLRTGDEISVTESKGGLHYGMNRRTGFLGWYPAYKSQEKATFVNFGV